MATLQGLDGAIGFGWSGSAAVTIPSETDGRKEIRGRIASMESVMTLVIPLDMAYLNGDQWEIG
jgi:hypothetical protein